MVDRDTRRLGDKVFQVSIVKPWRIAIAVLPKPRVPRTLSPLVLLSLLVIAVALGTLLLALPVSNKAGDFTSVGDALFTATSAASDTGHVVVDTGDYWTPFGQAVILFLIQIGGFSFMVGVTLLLLALGGRIGIRERVLIGESTMGVERWGGASKLVKRIAIFTILAEVIGAGLFCIRFWGESPPGTALWRSLFHSVSSFNNAGFAIFGGFRSLADYQTDTLVVLVTAALVILGGISFIVIADVFGTRRSGRLSLDTKIVLITTASLLLVGTAVILITEHSHSATLGSLPWPQKLMNAFFQSVTARTAGFTTIDNARLTDYSLFFLMILMFIGGVTGSTAGGIKVNTFGMIAATIWSSIRGRQHAGAFGRQFKTEQINRALAVAAIFFGLVIVLVLILTLTEDFRFLNVFYETVSAFGTVGLSTGITPGLSLAGKLIITATMFVGKVGPVLLALWLARQQRPTRYTYPEDEIRIG